MDAITDLEAGLRGEQPPPRAWDPRIHGQAEIGNYLRDRGTGEDPE